MSCNSRDQVKKKRLSEFIFRPDEAVYVSDINKNFNYSDGDDVERRLLEILRRVENRGVFSPELVAEISDWPSEYHFSPRRANIIRPLNFLKPGTKVLELGCGLGAITNALAERGCSVDAIEGSFRRAAAAAVRLKHKNNVRIHVANFQEVEFEPVYDVVTLIGVLEYSPVYIGGEDPFVECLKMAASALTPNGVLVIAIENKLGLKYLSGITEDHHCVSYYGIEGRYGPQEITTYGKRQLRQKLELSGFSECKFYYPYPDYKLPEVVLTDAGIRHPAFNVGDLISGLENRDYSGKGSPKFKLDLAWESVSQEGLSGDLANSFLVVASRGSLPLSVSDQVLAEKYTDDRRVAFNTVTRFALERNEIVVEKTSLMPDCKVDSAVFRHELAKEKYVQGDNLHSKLRRAISCGYKNEFFRLLGLWVEAIQSAAQNSMLPADWIDAHPGNFIINPSDELTLIDREWVGDHFYGVDFILCCGFVFLAKDSSIYDGLKFKNLKDAVDGLSAVCGIVVNPVVLSSVFNHRGAVWHDIYQSGAWKVGLYRQKESVSDSDLRQSEAHFDLKHVRLLAFYLPQFHEIPENNAWWGQGFTEWSNVTKAVPLFDGHDQPLVPTELGYYDLSSVAVMERQAKLARDHGIHGFCFYYYWFDGKRLLEKPVDQLLRAPHIDLPFCLCWANENWTRRWDGGEQEVLMPQSYSVDLNEQFARDLLPYFADPRYIRVEGKPVLLVYRTDIIPNLKITVAAWRAAWVAAGVGDVYLIAVESFRSVEPHASGFDAACEFPPHQVNFSAIAPKRSLNLIADPEARIGDYAMLRDQWLDASRPSYKRFRGLVPSWDNSARRRKGGATLFVNSSPAAYREWLREAVAQTVREFEGDERLVFINAWNEWAEGCTLEPSKKWGRAYLEATRDVLALPEELLVKKSRPDPYVEWLRRRSVSAPREQKIRKRSDLLSVAVAGVDSVLLERTRASLGAQEVGPRAVVTVADLGQLGETGWTLLINAGDTLESDAIFRLESVLQGAHNTSALLVYADHDELSDGSPANPIFKPDFSYELLLSCPYIGRAIIVRNQWASHHLFAHEGQVFDLVTAYRLALQAVVDGGHQALVHVPSLLLHLDRSEPAVFCTTSESWQALAGVLASHLESVLPGAQLLEGPGPGTFYVVPPLTRTPLVSVIIPTRDQLEFLSRCIESLLDKTEYPNFEILVVDNDSQTEDAKGFLNGLERVDPSRIRVLRVPGPFNFSRMNNLAVAQARGEFVLLLNNDTAALHADWLSQMMRHALVEGVGVVGARLLYPEGTVQHAGVIMGLRGPAEHPCLGLKADEPGYMFRAQLTQNFSAVTAACMLVSKATYDEIGGLDEGIFAVSYNDVDFCLRVGNTGRRIVWTPLATLLHEGSASQKAAVEAIAQDNKVKRFTREQIAMYERWPQMIASDPAYNPNLSLMECGYEVETNFLLCDDPRKGITEHRIVAFAADNTGCGHYRIYQPMKAMLEAGLCTGGASPELFGPNLALRSGADTLVFQRPFSDGEQALLDSLLPLKNIRKIYEVDDDLSRVPLKSAHREHMPKDIRSRMIRSIGLCDRLVVSTDTLAHQLRGSNDDIRVVLNRLPPAMWGDAPPAKQASEPATNKPRVGWAGGISHQGDLELIAQVVRETADQVDWIFFGMCPEVIRPYVKEFYAGVPTLDYPKRLMELAQSWDLAVAPLEINPFNESKSNLRLLEYGWCGLPVVCSDITPYQGDLPVRRVKNRYKDWRAAILDAVNERDASREMGQLLQKRIHADWMLKGDNLRGWYEAWTED